MTQQEFAQRDMELLDQILFYQSDNAEIVDLERQRIALRREYENMPPQRNLQGEIIRKEVA